MTDGLIGLGDNATTRQEQEALRQIAIANAQLLQFAIPHAPIEQLAQRLVQAIVTQQDLEDVLATVADPAMRESHPYWGMKIIRVADDVMLNHVSARKVLDPHSPTYAEELRAWVDIFAYVTTPMARVAWGALGVKIDFYQARTDTRKEAVAKPLLVTSEG